MISPANESEIQLVPDNKSDQIDSFDVNTKKVNMFT